MPLLPFCRHSIGVGWIAHGDISDARDVFHYVYVSMKNSADIFI